jgi:hypothetical protein
MVQEAKSPVKISSGSVARRDLIPAIKGYTVAQFSTLIYPTISFIQRDI